MVATLAIIKANIVNPKTRFDFSDFNIFAITSPIFNQRNILGIPTMAKNVANIKTFT